MNTLDTDRTDRSEEVCGGGVCAAVCPVFNLGGRCPSPVELLNMFRSERALVH